MQDRGIHIEGLRKRYGSGDTAVDALKGVNMKVAPGEVVGLIGPSGSGKSTLLKCLGAVIEPTSGRMALAGETIYDDRGWRVSDLRALRRDRIGFVFQAPYLIPFLDVTDNVAVLPMLAGMANGKARDRAREMLAALDVGHRAQELDGDARVGARTQLDRHTLRLEPESRDAHEVRACCQLQLSDSEAVRPRRRAAAAHHRIGDRFGLV